MPDNASKPAREAEQPGGPPSPAAAADPWQPASPMARWGGRLLLVLVLGALGANVFWISRNLDRLRALGPGKTAPLFTLRTIQEETVRLADLKGRSVLIDFWSVTCPPCLRSLPHLNQVAQRFEKRPVTVLALHVHGGPRWRRAVAHEVARMGLRVPVLLDTPRGAVSRAYTVRMLPTTVLVGPHGRIRRVWRGVTSVEDLEEAIEKTLGQ